jgi:transposase
MMLIQGTGIKVFLGIGQTDMRKSIDTLSILVSEKLEKEIFTGDLFVFCNRNRTILKILYWDRNGFCLWHKRLERDRFRWPQTEEEVKEISMRELLWLIEGLEINQPGAHERIKYERVY